MADYTATALITSIQKRGIFPSAQQTFQSVDFLRVMDEEMRLQIVPFINTIRENYFVDLYDQTIVDGVTNYQMSPRTVGMKVKNVYFVDSQGRPFELARIDIDDLPSLQIPTSEVAGVPLRFYFKDNDIVLNPTPQQNGTGNTLRQYYYLRRGSLVDTTAVGKITSLNTSTGVLTLNNVPISFTTSVTYDLIKGTPGFQTLKMDITPSAVTTNSITFSASDLPSGLKINDYVALSQESPIPQIPYDLFPLLAQRTVATVCRAINDQAGLARASEEVKSLEESARKLLSDRADEQSKKIVSANNIGQWVWGRFLRW